jgi:hypothetical protein
MPSNYRDTILELEVELQQANEKVRKLKTTINQLCELGGDPPAYVDIQDNSAPRTSSIRPDQFFGKGLATAAKEYLKIKGSAAALDEIYDALLNGGYEFAGDKKLWKRGLSISLSKNTQTFIYIKNNESFGLLEFYPDYKKKKEEKEEDETPKENTFVPPLEKLMKQESEKK